MCGTFEDNGFHGRLRSVPEDEEGLDLTYIRKALQKRDEKAKGQGNNTSV